jgi:hypothetical protein
MGQHVSIPSEFWLSSSLDPNTIIRRQISQTAPVVADARGIPVYKDLRISKEDVHNAWPRSLNSLIEGSALHTSPSCLKISAGEDGPFFETRSESLYNTRRTLKLKLENVAVERAVSEIRLTLLSVEPQSEYIGPWVLASGITFAAGDHTFIPLVSYGEADSAQNYSTSKYDRSDSFFIFLTGRSCPSPSKERPQYIRVRATGVGSAPCQYRGKVWVDRSDARLRISDAE